MEEWIHMLEDFWRLVTVDTKSGFYVIKADEQKFKR